MNTKKKEPLTNAQKQARFRAKRDAQTEQLKADLDNARKEIARLKRAISKNGPQIKNLKEALEKARH